MRVMIMAAGLGTRLRPLTDHLPKPIAPVGNRPCAEHLLRRIAAAGCSGAVMNLHYLPEAITATLGDGSAYGVPLEYSLEPELLEAYDEKQQLLRATKPTAPSPASSIA